MREIFWQFLVAPPYLHLWPACNVFTYVWCFFPFFLGVSELALPMAQQLQKKMSYEDARNWLTDYPRDAAAGLLPVALGKKGKDRDCARQALRLLVNLNQRETIEEIARGYNQPDV